MIEFIKNKKYIIVGILLIILIFTMFLKTVSRGDKSEWTELLPSDNKLVGAKIVQFDNLEEGEVAYQKDDYIFKIVNEKAVLLKYIGKDEKVKIPYDICDFTIVEIGPSAFSPDYDYDYNEPNFTLTHVEISESIEIINLNAFNGNNLTEIIIPNSVKIIYEGAFDNNKLTSVEISESVTEIKSNPFINNNIEKIKIHKDNTVYKSINNNIYTIDCKKIIVGTNTDNIEEVKELETIGKNAFRKIKRDLVIPKQIKIIEEGAFMETNIKNLVIPESVKIINKGAFVDSNLESIYIDKNVEIIGDNPFWGNKNLKSIKIHQDNLNYKSIDNAIYTKNEKILIVGSKNHKIRETTKVIANDAFFDLGITQITIPQSVFYIGSQAFYMNHLTKVTIPECVKFIGRHAFQNNNISELTLKEGVEVIGLCAFSNNKIETLNLPNSVKYIEGLAFYDNNIKNLYLNEQIEKICPDAFSFNDLTKINIPESLKFLSDTAFNNNPIIFEDIKIPENTEVVKYMSVHVGEFISDEVIEKIAQEPL